MTAWEGENLSVSFTKEELDLISFWLLVQGSPGFGKENCLELGRRRSRIHFECHVGDAC